MESEEKLKQICKIIFAEKKIKQDWSTIRNDIISYGDLREKELKIYGDLRVKEAIDIMKLKQMPTEEQFRKQNKIIEIEYIENKVFNPTKLWFKDAIFCHLKDELKRGKYKDYLPEEHIDRRTCLLLESEIGISLMISK